MASNLPSKMQAIQITDKLTVAKISEVPLPKIRPTYLLAKVDSIALNPTDWKHINGMSKRAGPGCISGCDFEGTVVEVGPNVNKSFKIGDRVAGTTHGGNATHPEDGCFAEYTIAKADLLVKLPDSLSFEDASTFPLGVGTVAQGLFQQALKLNLPSNPTKSGETVLIYGGSSATGSLGIQFAKAAGYRVITTCSPKNFEFVKALGAEAAYDYRDPECGKKINKDTNDSLRLIWDTLSIDSSAAICSEAFGSQAEKNDAQYGALLPVKLPREGIRNTRTFMYSIFNDFFTKAGTDFPASPEDFEAAREVFEITEKLLKEGKLKTHPAKIGEKGLEGALQGMKDLMDDKVSGQKLVYRVRETPAGSTASIEL